MGFFRLHRVYRLSGYYLTNMYIMKDTNVSIVLLFLLVIFLAIWFSASPSGHYNMPLFSKMYPYEGFHQRLIPLEYTGVNAPDQALDDTYALRSLQPSQTNCKKVSGFDGFGVFCNPTSSEQSIDIFSGATGQMKCDGYGYSNSRGSLCLTPEMQNLLKTRGANATGHSTVAS